MKAGKKDRTCKGVLRANGWRKKYSYIKNKQGRTKSLHWKED
jgi:hypothetical protein